jgi:hypothetical protein
VNYCHDPRGSRSRRFAALPRAAILMPRENIEPATHCQAPATTAATCVALKSHACGSNGSADTLNADCSDWPRALAVAVLRQALADLHHGSPRWRADAAAFLEGCGDGLDFWSSVAGLDADLIRQRTVLWGGTI